MARRQLPPRSTRGQLPPHLKIQTSPIKQVRVRKEDQQEIKRKQIEIRCKTSQINNLKRYPYCRAIHYFFDIDCLPRAVGAVSYALDNNNSLKNTFSKDSTIILGTPRKAILNRHLIGLPINCTGELPTRKQNKCKNVCYLYLQEIQDKKYNTDRVIYTLKIILKKINKIQNKQLQKYDFIKKDPELLIIIQNNISLQQKTQIISQKIKALQARKEINSINWKFEDEIYYYHALNQKLHNIVNEMKYKFTQEYFIKLLYEKQFIQYEYYDKKEEIKHFLTKVLNYYDKSITALSSNYIQHLIERAGINLIDMGPGQIFHIHYPIAILHFGRGQNLHTLTQFLVGRRAFNMGQTHFYQVKQMIKRLFDRNLKVKSQKIITYDQYFRNFRKRYEEIKKNPKKRLAQQMQSHFVYPFLDERINKNVIHGQNERILNLSNQIQLTKKQYIFLILYYWLLHCIAILYPYIIQYHDLLDIIGSDYFPKVCNSLVEAIGQPTVGLFFYIFEALTDLMSKNNQMNEINIKLIYEYDIKLNIGTIWRQQANCFEQDKIQNNMMNDVQFKSIPLKKIKQK